ncbi:MAG: gliding motility protein GldN [Bacteroidetes bacterium]|nr:gliding motility protein GldN [Bacteroidota bacterium]
MSNIKILTFITLFLLITSVKIKAQVMDSPPNDGVYEKIHVKNRVPIPYTPFREADAFWTKRIWRVIDMREKINQPFYYPTTPQNGRRSFMQVVLDGIKEGSIKAYDATSDEFLVEKPYEQFMKELNKTDSTQVEVPDPNNPGQTMLIDTVIETTFNPTSVKQIRLKEDWFFDKQRSVMDVRILGICPIVDLFEADGVTPKGQQPLFWIYFPDTRVIFANSEVYNNFNDALRLTYDDIFFKRMFNSYVYKESNVFDRRITEYAKGMDALLESERIKDEIFVKEHDLWEY